VSRRGLMPTLISRAMKTPARRSRQPSIYGSTKKIELNAFAIMNNHIHVIWQALPGHTLQSIQLSFMKFTAQQIKFAYMDNHNLLTEQGKVNKAERTYQIWKRDPLSIELCSEPVFL